MAESPSVRVNGRGGMEAAAFALWRSWATRRGYRPCSGCDENRYCGRAERGRIWLCLDCFDVSPQAEKAMER